jgi:hypothetical protein
LVGRRSNPTYPKKSGRQGMCSHHIRQEELPNSRGCVHTRQTTAQEQFTGSAWLYSLSNGHGFQQLYVHIARTVYNQA